MTSSDDCLLASAEAPIKAIDRGAKTILESAAPLSKFCFTRIFTSWSCYYFYRLATDSKKQGDGGDISGRFDGAQMIEQDFRVRSELWLGQRQELIGHVRP